MSRIKDHLKLAAILILSVIWILCSVVMLPMIGIHLNRLPSSMPMSTAAMQAYIPWLAAGLLFGLLHLLAVIALSLCGMKLSSSVLHLSSMCIDVALLYLCDALIAGVFIPNILGALCAIWLAFIMIVLAFEILALLAAVACAVIGLLLAAACAVIGGAVMAVVWIVVGIRDCITAVQERMI